MKKAFAVLEEGGRISILDYVRDLSGEAAFLDIHMLIHTREGRTWLLEDYTKWLTGAGFSNISVRSLGPRQFIRAEKRSFGRT